MNAIRQIVEVKDHKINIELPENFNADKVEVIIFPVDEEELYYVSEEEKNLMRERLKNINEEDFESWDSIRQNYL
ncbi:hypothetical protein IV494_11265 [Kaistella sp. G5-32]|uniref:Addiction module component n=1 Tax=Kaistella gelatinilytica TaxID=2787636 RepID=A0ABS0FDH2_9FLAO|nr:hypothetical protein [Kaistella gelatinilytica]MBF8457758.1 hypothetical protein [Kaistella gelatinilytica]